MTRRENQQHRRRPFRQSADRILVVCGGMVTEPVYFDGVKHCYHYDKGSCAEFEKFRIGIPDAIGRARELSPPGEEHQRNPSTGVWALVAKFERD